MPDRKEDHSSKPLSGKTALITGAARRLGRASALALARAGADVAITFRNSAREAQETVVDLSGFGVRAFALRCDHTVYTGASQAGIKRLYEFTVGLQTAVKPGA